MDSAILQFILILGVLYGLITFFTEAKKKASGNKVQFGLSLALIVACSATLLISME